MARKIDISDVMKRYLIHCLLIILEAEHKSVAALSNEGASTMAASQVPVSIPVTSCETTNVKIAEGVGSMHSVITADSTVPAPQTAGTRVVPFLYIQGTPGMRVGGTSSTSVAISTTSTGTQVVSSAIKSQFITTNAQFIPTLAPKLGVAPIVNPGNISSTSVVTTSTNTAKLIPAVPEVQLPVPATQQQQATQSQPHFVIQAPRASTGSAATIVPVSVAGAAMGKHTFAYLGTIIKPGMNMGKPGETQQLVLPATGLMPTPNQKLLLAPVLPPLAPAPAPVVSTPSSAPQQTKLTSLLVPMNIPASIAGNKSGMINVKISNGQIHTAEGKGAVTVLREAKSLSAVGQHLPPLQPFAKLTNTKVTNIKANGLLLPDSTTLTPLKEAATSITLPAKKNVTDEETSMKTVTITSIGSNASSNSITISTPVTSVSSTTNNNSSITSNITNSSIISNNTVSSSSHADEKKKLTQDLNKCLQETVDAIFSPCSPSMNKDNVEIKSLPEEDEVTLIKVSPTREEFGIKNEVKNELPEDDVKIEIVKPEVPLKSEQAESPEEFDPMKVLEWKDGIGALPGSNLKFCMNEFGMMEVVDDDDCKKLMSSKQTDMEIKDEPITLSDSQDQEKEKTVKKEEPEANLSESTTKENKKNDVVAVRPAGTSDDIFCCKCCGCYGLASEFISSSFCSDTCSAAFASKRAAETKRERDLQQLRLRRRKKRLLYLMQQKLQQQQQQKQLLQQQLQHQQQQLEQEQIEMRFRSANPPVTTIQSSTPSSSITTTTVKTPTLSEDENMSNDGTHDSSKPRHPWQTGKSGFSWSKYLEHCKAKAAPVKLFKDPFPYSKNGFKVGMKMEGIDPEHPSYYCVLTVADVQGYRIRLHFDGYSDNYDFWVNADSMDIFPAGWCEKNNHRLHPPRGYISSSFNWSAYLKHCRAQAAPRNLFANKTGSAICPNGFRLGMKLEAVDRKNSSLVCVATVAELMDNRILVHFDSWDDIYDYWADPTSPYIHPIGWCEEHGHTLTPPNNYNKGAGNKAFAWEAYLKETKSVSAPARAFKQRPVTGFRKGMKLECVDKRVPMLIRVASVDDVMEHQIKIKFDGWPDQYSYWMDDDNPDIHPMGWCQKTGHPLEPPLTPEDLLETSECRTPGCKGMGHVKGPKSLTHNNVVHCPYAAQNLNREGHIPDRILSKCESLDGKEEIIVKEKRTEGKNPVGRPPKWRRLDTSEEAKSLSQDPDWKIEDEENEKRKKKRRLLTEEQLTPLPVKAQNVTNHIDANVDTGPLRQELHQSVMNPGYEIKPDQLNPQIWAKHSRYLNQYVAAVKSGNPINWTVDQVAQFVWSIPDCCHVAHTFREQQIDGEAFLMMAQEDLVQFMNMKLGPAIKLYNSIVLLRQRIPRS